MTRRVAAIDCGTNSLRLLIADVDPESHRLTDVRRRMEIVRLGQGVDATGMLAPEALARTLRVLAQYAQEIRDAGATRVRMVATSASRDASNAADFTRGVKERLGIEPEVVTGGEEALLSFAGATTELAAGPRVGPALEPPYLVVDIGGGSNEFVLGGGQDGGLAAVAGGVATISVDIGCVRLTERHLRSDPPTDPEIKGAMDDIDAALETVAAAIAVPEARTLVGLAGSVTTVAAIALDLSEYDPGRTHHARISAATVHAVTQRLLADTRNERAAIGSMHPGRVDVIGAGALVLDQVIQRFGFSEVVASEHDILDGVAWSIAGD
ncbi:MAG TPA: Ppx/GppA phosphatase family protein [Streptosporangiaceae bacterium]|nr:Ppx/GppA phosphatase family protein [Streptosporangiaceae bacterium]